MSVVYEQLFVSITNYRLLKKHGMLYAILVAAT